MIFKFYTTFGVKGVKRKNINILITLDFNKMGTYNILYSNLRIRAIIISDELEDLEKNILKKKKNKKDWFYGFQKG